MKDPLQPKETPYEILGVQCNSTKQEIDGAFKKGISKSRDVAKLREAWNVLSKPLERALIDIFLYEESFINQLVPHVSGTTTPLLEKRLEIAKSWHNIQRKLFPYSPATHSLALLYYWWVLYLEEGKWAVTTKSDYQKKLNIPTTFNLPSLWMYVISHWVYLINCKEFWREWIQLKKYVDLFSGHSNIDSLCLKIEEHFINLFNGFSERYRINGDNTTVKRYREYELIFTTEMKAAKQLFNEGIKLNNNDKRFTICCGKIMLTHLGFLDSVKNKIEELLKGNPRNERLTTILNSFSPYANIAVLIENKKFDEAIKAIEKVPSEKKNEKEVLHLLAKALLEKGKQYFSLNKYEEAFKCWERGLITAELCEEIVQTVIFSCKSKVISLQRSNPNKAIEILRKGIEILENVRKGFLLSSDQKAFQKTCADELKENLSVIYCERGIACIIKAQKYQRNKQAEWVDENNNRKSVKSEIENGVNDLKQAVKIYPSNTRAQEQLKISENILAELDLWDVYEDVNAKQWEKAIEKLQIVLKKEPKNESAKKLLDVCNSYMCWFCKDKKNQPLGKSIEVKMHKETMRSGNYVQWQTLTISVPRCPRCEKAHKGTNAFTGIGGTLGFFMGLAGCISLLEEDAWFGGLIVLAVLTGIGAGIGNGIGMALCSRKTRAQLSSNNFPHVKQMVAEGWKSGEKPPGIQ